jgi:hypothetical protein
VLDLYCHIPKKKRGRWDMINELILINLDYLKVSPLVMDVLRYHHGDGCIKVSPLVMDVLRYHHW